MESGNYTLNHGLANTDADGVVEAALASCDADNKFCDEEVLSLISCVNKRCALSSTLNWMRMPRVIQCAFPTTATS